MPELLSSDQHGSLIHQGFDGLRDAANRLQALLDKVDDVEAVDAAAFLELMAAAGLILHDFDEASKLIGRSLQLNSGIARLRAYFLTHIGETVTTYELNGVSGIQESPRRVRELREDHGMAITAGPGNGLAQGEYRLEELDLDPNTEARLKLRNDIRATEGTTKDRCLLFLKILFPDATSKDDLAAVATDGDWQVHIRALQEDGWEVISSADDPSMDPGSCRLGSLEKGPRQLVETIRHRLSVLRRDSFSCAMCGSSPQTNRVTLQVHRLRSNTLTEQDGDLLTLCPACHMGQHSSDGVSATHDELLRPNLDPWSGQTFEPS